MCRANEESLGPWASKIFNFLPFHWLFILNIKIRKTKKKALHNLHAAFYSKNVYSEEKTNNKMRL